MEISTSSSPIRTLRILSRPRKLGSVGAMQAAVQKELERAIQGVGVIGTIMSVGVRKEFRRCCSRGYARETWRLLQVDRIAIERLTQYADLGDAQILEARAIDMLNDAFISDELPAPVGAGQS